MTQDPTLAAPSLARRLPWCTLLLAVATAVLSVHAAIDISGSWLGKVKIVQLEDYGLRFEYLREGELWRLVTAQLVHVKQPHMVSDVVCLLWIGALVERHVGPLRLFLLWLVGGSIATLVSTQFVTPPWNLGTGASQAIMAIAGAGLWLVVTGADRSKAMKWALAFTIALAMTLDLIFAHYPKPGHVSGLVLGFLMAWLFRQRK